MSTNATATSLGSAFRSAFTSIRDQSQAYIKRVEQVVDRGIHHPMETVMANEPWLLFSICFSAITSVSLYLSSKSKSSNEVFFDKACLTLWISCAACLCLSVTFTNSSAMGAVWLSTYITEVILSLENILAYHAVFSFHRVPTPSRPKGLVWGIGIAMFVRFVFLVVGGALLYGSSIARFAIAGSLMIVGGLNVSSLLDTSSQQRRAKAYQIASMVCSFCEKLIPQKWWEWLSHNPSPTADDDQQVDNQFATDSMTTPVSPTTPILLPGQSKWAIGVPIIVTVLSIELCDSFLTMWNTFAVVGQTSSLFITYSSTAFALMTVRSIYLVMVAHKPNAEPQLYQTKFASGLVTLAVGLQLFISYKAIADQISSTLILSGIVVMVGLGLLVSNLYESSVF